MLTYAATRRERQRLWVAARRSGWLVHQHKSTNTDAISWWWRGRACYGDGMDLDDLLTDADGC
jgi:hypothetical protein